MRHWLKRAIEKTLAQPVLLSVLQKRVADDVVILAYHNIVPSGDSPSAGDASLHLEQQVFARQLDWLRETRAVIPLSAILDPPTSRSRPRVAITFDDAYEGALTVGVEELVRRGLPATIFVSPGLIGQQTWWDFLGARSLLSEDSRRFALDELRGDREAVLSWAQRLGTPQGSSFRIGAEAQVLAAATRPGITLGSHTWSHLNLCSLTLSEIEAELTRPLEWLTARLGKQNWALSYPYGMHSEQVERAAEAAGYVSAFRVDGGALRRVRPGSRYALPRLNIPAGLSLDGFRLRLAGLA